MCYASVELGIKTPRFIVCWLTCLDRFKLDQRFWLFFPGRPGTAASRNPNCNRVPASSNV